MPTPPNSHRKHGCATETVETAVSAGLRAEEKLSAEVNLVEGGFTRRRFIQSGLMAGAFFLLPTAARAQDAGAAGKMRLVFAPGNAWPWAASFSKYAVRVSFADIAEANKRVKGRRYPIQLRTK